MNTSQNMDPCPQQAAISIAPTPSPLSRTSFSDLPFEIRHQIWLLTFEPRILCLHINQHVTPAPLDAFGDEIQESPRTLSLSFDYTIATSSPSNEFDEYLTRHEQLVTIKSARDIPHNRTPFGPVALHVCQESRTLASQRYKRAFGRVQLNGAPYSFFTETCYALGDNSAWNNVLIQEPRIWIDFERDVVVVDSTRRPRVGFPDRTPFGPLSLIRIFAKEESRNIRRLGVAARHLPRSGAGIVSVLRGRTFSSLRFEKEWLLGFDNLKELILDDVPHRGRRSDVPGLRRSHLPRRPHIRLREELLDSLRKAGSADPARAAVLPEIQMVKDNNWNEFL